MDIKTRGGRCQRQLKDTTANHKDTENEYLDVEVKDVVKKEVSTAIPQN
jgi:hypothetical protein